MWASIRNVIVGVFRGLFGVGEFKRAKEAVGDMTGVGSKWVPRPVMAPEVARAQAESYHHNERSRYLREVAGQMAVSLLSASEMADALHDVESDSPAALARRAWEVAQSLYDEGERRGAFPNVDAYVEQITQQHQQPYATD